MHTCVNQCFKSLSSDPILHAVLRTKQNQFYFVRKIIASPVFICMVYILTARNSQFPYCTHLCPLLLHTHPKSVCPSSPPGTDRFRQQTLPVLWSRWVFGCCSSSLKGDRSTCYCLCSIKQSGIHCVILLYY